MKLEAAAEALRRRRRAKLLELAEELQVGRVQHRLDARTAALNTLRLAAVHELQTEAAAPEEVKDLPGPQAAEWLHWACSLRDSKDGETLMCLRRDFDAIQRFAEEMEASYWLPAQHNEGNPGLPDEPCLQSTEEPPAATPTPTPSCPERPSPTLPWETGQRDAAYVESPASTARRMSFESQPTAVSQPAVDSTWAASQIECCDKDVSGGAPESDRESADYSPFGASSNSFTGRVGGHAIAPEARARHMESSPANLYSGSPLPSATKTASEPGIVSSAEHPTSEASTKLDDAEYEELKSAVRWHYSAADETPPNLLQRLLGKRR